MMLGGSDSRFFEESINASKLKDLLDGRSHTAASGIKERTQAMKWLLAMVSKGRDVSQFYPDVVKNVIVKSVELKKLVYVYLIHYTDHDQHCRELALLSINSFQKDLADRNPLIRALALRTMTSIRVRDIIQLQLMAVQKCALDVSAYVRKTAAHALPKLYRIDKTQKEELVELVEKLLVDRSTMVIGSAMAAYQEICPDRFDVIHPIFRRLCAILPDVDEWGQIVMISVLTRYARQFFTKPQMDETAVTLMAAASIKNNNVTATKTTPFPSSKKVTSGLYYHHTDDDPNGLVRRLPTAKELQSFYDDEDDNKKKKSGEHVDMPVEVDDEEEEAEEESSSSSDEERDKVMHTTTLPPLMGNDSGTMEADHKLLLKSCLPLLRSRNSGVVLAVVSIMWECGRRSPVAMEKLAGALTRLLRSHREVQFVALNAIVPIASEMPHYFRPYLKQFFVNGSMDAAFVRQAKVDVLTLLANESNVEEMLLEFEVYLGHPDKSFVCSVIRAVGRLVNQLPSISTRCLRGLVTLMTSEYEMVVAEAVVVMRTILQQHPDNTTMVHWLVRMFGHVKLPTARASVIWVASEFAQHVLDLAPELLRQLVMQFEEEGDSDVKQQTLNLGVRLHLECCGMHSAQEFDEATKNTIKLLLEYALELARYDTDYDLRDRVRFIKGILDNPVFDHDAKVKLLLCVKPPPLVQRIETHIVQDCKGRFTFDSLSHIVGHSAFGYQALVDWPTLEPNPTLRDPITTTSAQFAMTTTPKTKTFYDSDSSSGSSSSSSSSSSPTRSRKSRSGSESSNTSNASSSSSNSSSGSSSNSSSDSSSESDSEQEPKSKSSNRKEVEEPDDVLSLFDSYSSKSSPTPPAISVNLNDALLNSKPSSPGIGNPNNDMEWKTLLSNVHGDGLLVRYGFTRQVSQFSKSMCLVALELTNKRSSNLSNVKIGNTDLMAQQQLVPFPEIDNLAPGEVKRAELHVDFAGKANQPCKFSFSTDRGSFPVSLEVPWGELLYPSLDLLESDKFEAVQKQLTGMHEASQKFESNLSVSEKFARMKRAANIAMQSLQDGAIVRGAGRKLSDFNVQVIVELTPEHLKVASDDVLLANSIFNEIAKQLK